MVPVYFHSFGACSDLMLLIYYQVQGPFMHRNLPLDRFHLKKEKEPGRKQETGLKEVHFKRTLFL